MFAGIQTGDEVTIAASARDNLGNISGLTSSITKLASASFLDTLQLLCFLPASYNSRLN